MADAAGAASAPQLCLAVPEGTLLAWSELVLAPCDDQSLEQQLVVQAAEDAGSDAAVDGWVRLLTLGSQGEHCVRLDWLHLQADRPVFQYVADDSAVDLWRLNATDGSVRTALDERWCVTAGARPILRAVAATDDSRSQLTTVVVLNRAAHAQPFELVDADLAVTIRGLSAPAHSMLTLRYNASDVLRATDAGGSPGEETQAAAVAAGEWASGLAWGFGMASLFWIVVLAVIGGVVGVAMRRPYVRSPKPASARVEGGLDSHPITHKNPLEGRARLGGGLGRRQRYTSGPGLSVGVCRRVCRVMNVHRRRRVEFRPIAVPRGLGF